MRPLLRRAGWSLVRIRAYSDDVNVRGVRRLAVFGVAALAALVMSHELVYLTAYGSQAPMEMAARGHDSYWSPLVLVVFAAVFAIGVVVAVRIWKLSHLVRVAGRATRDGTSSSAWLPMLARYFLALSAATVVLFAIQENAEMLFQHRALPGIGVVAHGGGSAVVLILGVSFMISLVVTAVRRRHETLAMQLESAGLEWPHQVIVSRPVVRAVVPAGAVTGPASVRAPPTVMRPG